MSFPRYPNYKDSGVEWLGEVPEHWEVTRLKNIASLNMGQSPSSEDCTPEPVGLPFLQGNADFGEVFPLPRSYCAIAPKLANGGDILFSVRAPVGAINVADQPYGIGRGLCAITPSSDSSLRFVFHALQLMKSELFAVATGSTYEAVSTDQVGNATCFAPPLPEQTQIAAFLDRETAKIDELVAEQRRLMELLKEKRQAVISHAVTQGLNPHAPMKPSGIEWLGDVPEHWEVMRLRFVAKLNPSKSEVGNLDRDTVVSFLPMVAIGEDGTLNLEVEKPISDLESGYTYFRDGDVTIAKITPCYENGKGALMLGLLNGIGFGTTELIVVRPHPDQIIGTFLHFLFISTVFRDLGESHMYGAGGQKRVPDEFVRNFATGFPPLNEQTQISAFLDAELAKFDTLTSEAQRAIALLQERRTALISAAVTGQIDIREFA